MPIRSLHMLIEVIAFIGDRAEGMLIYDLCQC